MTPERWLPVVGYEGLYEVSDLGRVRSLDRLVHTQRGVWTYRGTVLSLLPTHGYLFVMLARAGQKKRRPVHQLVLESFVGPCPTGMEVRHFPDRTRTNNEVSNLSWGTPFENAADKVVHGTTNIGTRSPSSKLTESDVTEIRRLVSAGETCKALGARFGCCPMTISHIARRVTWRHL